ncbi:MAG: acyltransferase family protein [Clostridiales bacterium]|nr:acyltransferase family protein [Clostridiales bacterium]
MATKERLFGLDLVRGVAVYFVISIHFFLNNGFYNQPVEGAAMWTADCLRGLVYCCVPMFMLLTGYLKGNREWKPGYYRGLLPILISWLMISLISILFKILYYKTIMSPVEWLGEILDFKAANYSWYIEMYIGLFLMSPFLNTAFHGIRNPGYHKAILAAMIFITFLPSVLCGWEAGETVLNFVPNYWTALYPITYYWIGCYIKEYQPKIPLRFLLPVLAVLVIGQGTFHYFTANGGKFHEGLVYGYSGLSVAAISVCLFLIMYRAECRNRVIKKGVGFLSKISMEVYLMSWFFDKLFYEYAATQGILLPENYWWCYPLMTLSVLVCTCIPAWLVHAVSRKMSEAILAERKKGISA